MIKSIVIKIGKHELGLTPKEVKELKLALDEIYTEPKEIYKTEYVPIPSMPVIIERRYPYWWDTWYSQRPMYSSSSLEITCKAEP